LIAYVDSSVVLRLVLGSANPLEEWQRIQRPVASDLLRVECLRTLARIEIVDRIDPALMATRRTLVDTILRSFYLIAMDRQVLDRAAGSFPVPLKALDALHMATALLWRTDREPDLSFATHDIQLAHAARSLGFTVLGA
jgi:predicted nucleic acid-binding protein